MGIRFTCSGMVASNTTRAPRFQQTDQCVAAGTAEFKMRRGLAGCGRSVLFSVITCRFCISIKLTMLPQRFGVVIRYGNRVIARLEQHKNVQRSAENTHLPGKLPPACITADDSKLFVSLEKFFCVFLWRRMPGGLNGIEGISVIRCYTPAMWFCNCSYHESGKPQPQTGWLPRHKTVHAAHWTHTVTHITHFVANGITGQVHGPHILVHAFHGIIHTIHVDQHRLKVLK